MNDAGIELALLEGMDEDLLLRLHQAGVRRRDDLGGRLTTLEARREFAQRLGVPYPRIEALYLLNFLLPEERVARAMNAERAVNERLEELRRENRWLRRAFFGVAVALVGLLLVAVVFLRPPPPSAVGVETESLGDDELAELRERVDALQPLARDQARADLDDGLSRLGPAPGWRGPLNWNDVHHRALVVNLGEEPATEPERAVSLALLILASVENAPDDSLSVAGRAAEAASVLQTFPPPGPPTSLWDAAAVSIRLRLASRALGLAPLEAVSPETYATVPWEWTEAGFLRAELLMARVEALPLEAEVLPSWSETLVGVRTAANAARDALGARPEAWARDYWIRRSELEMAVTAALLDRPTMLPYAAESPAQFLAMRGSYLRRTLEKAPVRARGSLAWLVVEYEEARRLLDRLAATPSLRAAAVEKPWVDALGAVEAQIPPPAGDPGELGDRLAEALALSGVLHPDDPWTVSRTRWECGLRPLLMETRAIGRAREAARRAAPTAGAPRGSTDSH